MVGQQNSGRNNREQSSPTLSWSGRTIGKTDWDLVPVACGLTVKPEGSSGKRRGKDLLQAEWWLGAWESRPWCREVEEASRGPALSCRRTVRALMSRLLTGEDEEGRRKEKEKKGKRKETKNLLFSLCSY